MKKTWKEAELVEANICDTACWWNPCWPKPEKPEVGNSGDNTKPQCKPVFPCWPWF